MNRFEFINKNLLTPDGIIKQIRLGILPLSVRRHFEIYSKFDYYKKQGHNVSKSVLYVSEDFRITEDAVYKIKKTMETEI